MGSSTCHTSRFSKLIFTYQLLEFLLFQKLIFNVQKFKKFAQKNDK
jgi:hypothetical protein